MGRLGVFGGTFDPPHIAHLILADEAYDQLRLDRVLWVLTPEPPHKEDQPITPLEHRLDMLAAAIEGNPAYELCKVDINRPPPHYAVDTVRILREETPAAEWVYLMGGDSLRDLPTWKTPLEFLAACDALGVMRRPADCIDLAALESQLPGLNAKVRFVDTPLLNISAGQIRQRVADGRPFRYLLPPAVYAIIEKRGLYRVTQTLKVSKTFRV